jgi:uncharacterized membrane protein (GlpM family)
MNSGLSMGLMFLLELTLKMAMTAAIVVVASIVVERSGPFIGAIIAALPTAAGAVYIILAIEHPPAFIATSAIGTLAANAAVAVFAIAYAALAQRHGLVVTLGGAIATWLVCAAILHAVDWTALSALLLNAGIFALTIPAGRRFRDQGLAKAQTRTRLPDLAWRAATVAVCVAIVTTASLGIGSFASGMFAVFPVAMASFVIILHPRIGGPAAASVLAHVEPPLIGLSLGFLAVHYLAVPLGVWWSYAVGLVIVAAWNGLLWFTRRAQSAAVGRTGKG